MSQPNTKLQSLDILKGIAILMIIVVHNRHFTLQNTAGFRQLINFGQMGCQIFFLVSGMALCYSWSHSVAKQPIYHISDWFSHYCSFIKSRYLRLAPGFLLILGVNYLLNVILIDWFNLSAGFVMNREPAALLSNILFIHGLSPAYINNVFPGGWYIGTTFLLYLLFPVLISIYTFLYKRCPHSIIVLPLLFWSIGFGLLLLLSRMNNPLLSAANNSYLYFCVLNQLPCFSLGITLYYQEQDNFSVKVPLLISVPFTVITLLLSIYLFIRPIHPYIFFILPTLTGFAFYWLAVVLLHLEKKGALIQLSFLISCGRNSYGMYLIHAFFCWYGIKALTAFLTQHNISGPDLVLYIILLPITIFCVYHAGKLMTRLLDIIDSKLRFHSKRSL